MTSNYLDDIALAIRQAVPTSAIPNEDTSDLFRSYAILLLAKGQSVAAADVHNAWVAWRTRSDPSHSALVPFEQLDSQTAADDEPFVEAIRTVAKNRPNAAAHEFDLNLFPRGAPSSELEANRMMELYKIMVASSESLVSRRQGVNTFFLTINGAILTAVGLVLGSGGTQPVQAGGLLVLTLTGAILSWAWRSLLVSAGQLNAGKFAVINRIEQEFPVAIYFAEWKALEEGRNPKRYRSFTSREVWPPMAFLMIYLIASAVETLVIVGAVNLPTV